MDSVELPTIHAECDVQIKSAPASYRSSKAAARNGGRPGSERLLTSH